MSYSNKYFNLNFDFISTPIIYSFYKESKVLQKMINDLCSLQNLINIECAISIM